MDGRDMFRVQIRPAAAVAAASTGSTDPKLSRPSSIRYNYDDLCFPETLLLPHALATPRGLHYDATKLTSCTLLLLVVS